MEKLQKKLYLNHSLEKDELIYLLENIDKDSLETLFKYAKDTLLQSYGSRIFIRGLLEISNFCKNNCLYCGIRRDNHKVRRYRMTPEQILECCKSGWGLGFRTFVLQGGEDAFYDDKILTRLVRDIKSQYPGTAVTLSLGERSYSSYKSLFEAGADRYLLRHETASEDLYTSMHPGMDFNNRREALFNLKKIGFQTGAGFIVGLPNQTAEVLVEDLLFLKELNPEMVGIGPLIPHPDTPLGNLPVGSGKVTNIMIALTRLLLPKAMIPATTALLTLDRETWHNSFDAGANVVMMNLTPSDKRINYEIYKNKKYTGIKFLDELKEVVNAKGLSIDWGRGDCVEWVDSRKHKGEGAN